MISVLRKLIYAFVCLSFLLTLIGVQPAYAAGIVVNTNADNLADDDLCTLREAITTANSDVGINTGDCTAGSGVDTITFATNYTITLTTQLPPVTTAITITGNSAADTIIQASTCDPINLPGGCTPAKYRIFQVTDSGNLTLNNLTVRHGFCKPNSCEGDTTNYPQYGGGVLNDGGTLTVTNSIIANNMVSHNDIDPNDISGGGGISSTGNLTITNSIIQNNRADYGGGVSTFSPGVFRMNNSIVSGNRASSDNFGAQGGGIHNNSTDAIIKGSLISGNIASDFNKDAEKNFGGGILNLGSLTIINTTITGNIAGNSTSKGVGGGIANYGGFLTNTDELLYITNSTLSGNKSNFGGALANESKTALIINSILANSQGAFDCYNNPNRAMIGLQNSILETNDPSKIYNSDTGFWGELACEGTFISADPKLSALANNGGPTQTLALLPGSPAIDAGDDDECSASKVNNLDQRGITRPYGSHCDIGAYEYDPPFVISITRASASPTSAASVDFTVTFSKAVTGVDSGDFSLTTSGVSDASITNVSGSGSVYTVSVNTGSGNGAVRLDIPYNTSITDIASNALTGLPYVNGETYSIIRDQTFSDTPTSYWAWQYIERLYNSGITGGCATNPLSYCPTSPVTRGQMAVFLLRGIHGSGFTPPAVGGSTGFTDVDTGYWAAAWIKQLAAEAITGGCGSGVYCPEDTVTRAQMAVFLLKATHGSSYSPPNVSATFGDTSGHWAEDWIEQLAAEGITSGCGGGLYCPDNPVTRDQMAVFLVKAFNLP
ncbi:MAG TPA: choice-of-anchor Q domain-containing protein [Anaerolineales bacterium]|nr:choice-of-anchor Q domain-containing protein [Anaerolineales bacterium]